MSRNRVFREFTRTKMFISNRNSEINQLREGVLEALDNLSLTQSQLPLASLNPTPVVVRECKPCGP